MSPTPCSTPASSIESQVREDPVLAANSVRDRLRGRMLQADGTHGATAHKCPAHRPPWGSSGTRSANQSRWSRGCGRCRRSWSRDAETRLRRVPRGLAPPCDVPIWQGRAPQGAPHGTCGDAALRFEPTMSRQLAPRRPPIAPQASRRPRTCGLTVSDYLLLPAPYRRSGTTASWPMATTRTPLTASASTAPRAPPPSRPTERVTRKTLTPPSEPWACARAARPRATAGHMPRRGDGRGM
jgi:hypothetical protein